MGNQSNTSGVVSIEAKNYYGNVDFNDLGCASLFCRTSMISWEKTTDKIIVPNTFDIDSNLGVMVTSKTGNSNKHCPVNPVAKRFQESSIEERNSCQSEQTNCSDKVFWSSQSQKGGVFST